MGNLMAHSNIWYGGTLSEIHQNKLNRCPFKFSLTSRSNEEKGSDAINKITEDDFNHWVSVFAQVTAKIHPQNGVNECLRDYLLHFKPEICGKEDEDCYELHKIMESESFQDYSTTIERRIKSHIECL